MVASKRYVNAKKIQKGTGPHYITISKEAVKLLKLRAQDPNCLLVEVPDPARRARMSKMEKL